MSKEENMESKTQSMYDNPTFRSDTHVVFSLYSLSTFWKYSGFYLFYAF